VTLVHWDDVPSRRPERKGVGGAWSALGRAAGSVKVGLNRIRLDPGEVSTPAHVHGADEEIFFVLAGSGLSWQDGETYEVRAGDCLVHAPLGMAHTLRGGDGGLDVLVFGPRTRMQGAYLPKVGVSWLFPSWVDSGGTPHPFDREPNLEWPEPGERPASIVNLDDVAGRFGGRSKRLAEAAGAIQAGLNWGSFPAGEEGAPPHCHSAEEELFVILDGEAELLLWSSPKAGEPIQTEPAERHPVRRGHVIARPAGTRVPHSFLAGAPGFTYLAYGQRDTSDICWYPRSNKLFFRGVGVIARLEQLDYLDGEPG
jgi:uncharacterized cupin superfamily protein